MELLIGTAVGAGLSSVAYIAASRYKPTPPPTVMTTVFELSYERFKSAKSSSSEGSDPLNGRPSQALVELATSCGLKEYTLDAMYEPGPGWNAQSTLRIRPATMSDEMFNCVSDKLRPPYLTLKRVEVCRRVAERNPAAPKCPVVLY